MECGASPHRFSIFWIAAIHCRFRIALRLLQLSFHDTSRVALPNFKNEWLYLKLTLKQSLSHVYDLAFSYISAIFLPFFFFSSPG